MSGRRAPHAERRDPRPLTRRDAESLGDRLSMLFRRASVSREPVPQVLLRHAELTREISLRAPRDEQGREATSSYGRLAAAHLK